MFLFYCVCWKGLRAMTTHKRVVYFETPIVILGGLSGLIQASIIPFLSPLLYIIRITIFIFIYKRMNKPSRRSRSPSNKKKKDKQRQYHKDSSKYNKESFKSRRKSESPSPSQKKKKEKYRSRKDKSRSRERSRSKNRNRDRSRSRDKHKKSKFKQSQRESSPKKNLTEEDRQRKFAMRQVRARLLKLNGLLGQQQDSAQQKPAIDQQKKSESLLAPPPPPPMQSSNPPIIPKKSGKRQSKWGKTSSQPSVIPVAEAEPILPQDQEKRAEDNKNNLSIDIQPSLGLSEDKSIEVQNNRQPEKNLHQMSQQIDPLDMYMNEIQQQAVPQVQLPKKGQKGNVISFQDIVTQNQNSTQFEEGEQQDQKFKSQFMQAINKMEQVKNQQKEKKGTLMEHNEEKQDNFSDLEEGPDQQLDFFAKQRKLAERKQLNKIDHSEIQYEDVAFNLYREAEEVRDMDPKAVIKYRKQAGDIKIRGKHLLNPVKNWYLCGFSEAIISTIEKNNYEKPFPIQAQSIPMILSGRDVIGIAETGSGKTFAYLLPMLKHIGAQRPVREGQGPIGLIMTPTRELANQVFMQAKKFCKSTKIRIIAVYGGLQIQKQLSDLKKGAEMVICTPGRMIDLLTINKGKVTNLKRVTMVVLDEADRMFDLGFEPQITRILDNIRPHRQTVMFSATFPKNVENLARRILTNPVQILVGSRGQACRNVEQIIQVRDEPTKFLRLLEILGQWNQKGSILIFIDKQNQADYLYQQLARYGYDTLVLHGAMDPTDRQFTIYDFKKRIKTIMISTSVCARGLDIKEIILVVNFKCPNHLEDYIHRIGRTGRAGNKGTAITFITPQQEQYSIDLIKALEMSEIQPPQDLIKLSQQFLKKVKKGEARKIKNRNIQGAGFKFDKEEEQKATQIKDMIKKQLKNEGLGDFQDSDEDDIEKKKMKEEQMRGRNQQERVVEAIKNPQVKNKLLNEAVKAVSQAIKNDSGMTTQKILQIAVNSMKQSVIKHKVISTVDDGVEKVTQIINEFTKKGTEGVDFFSYDFQINDYPPGARQKACSQHFLNQVQRDNNCTISLRGVHIEPGKKVPIGNRKLYLHIQSEDKSYVQNAYKDIKRVIQESAYQNIHMSAMNKYSI